MELSLLSAARDAPGHTALIHGARSWSYREAAADLQPLLEALSGSLEKAGAGAVALVGHLRPETIFTVYALLELRRPVVLLHPRLTAAENEQLLRESGAVALLDPQPGQAPETWTKPAPASQTKSLAPSQTKSLAPSQAPSQAEPLLVIYTSGSSGRPKGVVLSRRAVLASAQASAENLGWRDDDRWLLNLPLGHVGGFSILTRCLAARRCVVLSEQTGFSPEGFAAQVDRHRITLASLVPTMLHRLLALAPPWTPPPHLRAVLLGGAGAPAQMLARAAERGIPILTTYGMTETCSQVATQSYSELQEGLRGDGRLGAGSLLGKTALGNTEIRIADGEIQVRGSCLMTGYLPLGEKPSPFLDGGWFPTGDLGTLDEAGRLHVLGRKGDRIITGGENVDPAEVEGVLRLHPGIRDTCVVGVEHPEWGQQVCAALVLDPHDWPGDEALTAWLSTRLAGFKRPRRWSVLDALPLLPSGKVNRRAVTRHLSTLKATAG